MIAHRLDCHTCDRKVAVQVPTGVVGKFSPPGSAFCADFEYPFHPCVTAGACKNPGHPAKSAVGN